MRTITTNSGPDFALLDHSFLAADQRHALNSDGELVVLLRALDDHLQRESAITG